MFCTAKYFICFNPNSLKTMKTSNPHCVPAILKTAVLAAILAVPATPAFARTYYDEPADSSDGVAVPAAPTGVSAENVIPWKTSVELNAFYGLTTGGDTDSVLDTAGLTLVGAAKADTNAFLGLQGLTPELFAFVRAGTGVEKSINFLQGCIGVRLRFEIDERISLFAGAYWGVGYLYMDVDTWKGNTHYIADISDIASCEGYDGGVEFALDSNSAFVIGVGYEKRLLDYVNLSIGYKVSF